MKIDLRSIIVCALAVVTHAVQAGETASGFGGAYVGVNAGGALGSAGYATDPGCPPPLVDATFCNVDPDPSAVNGAAVANDGKGRFSSLGFTGGLQAGYNWQKSNIVFGGEADFSALQLDASTTADGTFPFAFLGTNYALRERMSANWLSTLRARLGLAITPDVLLYATGGIAFTDLEIASTYADNAIDVSFPGGTGSGSTQGVRTGFALGAGGEWRLGAASPWSVKAEYLYADFGSVSFAVPTSNTAAFEQTMRVKADVDVQIVRVGINFRY